MAAAAEIARASRSVAMVHEPGLFALHCCRGQLTQESAAMLCNDHGGRSANAPPEALACEQAAGLWNARAKRMGKRANNSVAELVVAQGLAARCCHLPPARWPAVGQAELAQHSAEYLAAIDATEADGPPVPPGAMCQSCSYTRLPNTPDRSA